MFDPEPINKVLDRIRQAQQAKSKDVRFTIEEMTLFAATIGQLLLNVKTPSSSYNIPQVVSIEGGSMKAKK